MSTRPAMDLLQAIAEIVRPAIMHPGPIVLAEDDPGSQCDPITLRRQGRAVAIRPDMIEPAGMSKNDRLFPWFKTDTSGLTRLCDYIVFYRAARPPRLFVFLCELKSRNRRGAGEQVANGRLVSDYVMSMAMHHFPVIENLDVRYRALVFSTGHRNAKGPSKPGKFRYTQTLPQMDDVGVAYLGCGGTFELIALCD